MEEREATKSGAKKELLRTLKFVLFSASAGVIEVGAENFAFDGLTMLMVPANLGALDQISDLSDKKAQLEDNYHKLDNSIDTLLNSFSGMSASLRETADGLDELNEGRAIISEDKEGLYGQADTALNDVDTLRGDLTTASENAADLQKTVQAIWKDKGHTDEAKDIKVYVKPEENMAYYVVNNGEEIGSFGI